ncbi:hypothetical protein, partial [Salmonella sp. SAL4450]|uniref:hypothetical protein n=1 Tax=Salmonella sp. SAL4450 TaxID=3159905 RepID=UPI003979D69E
VLDSDNPDRSNAAFTLEFDVDPGQTNIQYQVQKSGVLPVNGLTGTIGVNRVPALAINTGVSLDNGATQTIGNGNLRVTDADAGDTITYT